MANFKVVCQFTQPDHGFTEVYYRQADNLAAASVFSSRLIASILNYRAELTSLRKIRISDVLNNRSSVVVNINQTASALAGTADMVFTAAIVTLNSPSIGARRQLWVRGLTDDSVKRNLNTGLDEPSANLLAGINQHCRALSQNGFAVRALSRLTVPPLVYTNIMSVVVAGSGFVTFVVPNTWNLTTSRRVILSQFSTKEFAGLNGHWTATQVDATHFTVPYTSALPPGTYLVSKGRTRPEEYVYGVMDYTTSGFNRFGSRDTGKNPLGGRGRRSAPRIRSA